MGGVDGRMRDDERLGARGQSRRVERRVECWIVRII